MDIKSDYYFQDFNAISTSNRRNLLVFQTDLKIDPSTLKSHPISTIPKELCTRNSMRSMLELDQTYVFNQSLTGPNGYFLEHVTEDSNQLSSSRNSSFSKRRLSVSSDMSSTSLYQSTTHFDHEERVLQPIPENHSSSDSGSQSNSIQINIDSSSDAPTSFPDVSPGASPDASLHAPPEVSQNSFFSFAPSVSRKDSTSIDTSSSSPSIFTTPATPPVPFNPSELASLSPILRILTTETIVSIEKQGTPSNFKVNGNLSLKLGSVPMNAPLLILVFSSVRQNISKISAHEEMTSSVTIEKSPDQTHCLVLDTQSLKNLKEDPLLDICKYQLTSSNSTPLFRVKNLLSFLPKNEKNSIEKIRIMVQVALNRQLDIPLSNVKFVLNLAPVLKEIKEDFTLSNENFNFLPSNGVLDLPKKTLTWDIPSLIPSEKPVLELLIQINVPRHPTLENIGQIQLPLNIKASCEKSITDFKINVQGLLPENVLYARKVNIDYRFL